MHPDRFDNLARRIALFGRRAQSRRTFLKHAGATTLGSAILFAGKSADSAAQDTPTSTPRPVVHPDYEQLLFDLDYDMENIFRHVSDNVRYEPYSGVLRGALGVLWGYSGNAFDQALLLYTMLDQALVPVRLVTGTLNEDAAERMIASAQIDAAAVREERRKIVALSESQILSVQPAPESTPAGDEYRREFVERAASIRPRMIERARSDLTYTAELLSSSLQGEGIEITTPMLEMPDSERFRHVWVQISQGSGWLDLDPSVPGAQIGDVFATDEAQLEEIADTDYHTVTFRIVADVVRNGELVEEELLKETVQSATVVGAPISFVHANPSWIGGTISNTISGQVEYRPYIQVGATTFEGLSLFFGGQGGVLDALGGSDETEGEFFAERLEITVSSPGDTDIVETRTIFDRISDDDRFSDELTERLGTIPPVELVDLSDDAGKAFLPFVGASNIGVVSTPVPMVYFLQDRTIPDAAMDLAGLVHGYHFLRDMLGAELAAEIGTRFIRDRPSVTLLDIGVKVNDQNEQVFQYSLDLVQPTLRAVPLEGIELPYPPQLIDGVLGQVAERNLLEVGAETFPEIIGATFTNIGTVFEAADAQGVRILTVSPDGLLPAPLKESVSVSVGARMEEHLAQGLFLVVPERPVELAGGATIGWWAIDPVSGRTIDRMQSGRGSELGEHATLLDVIVHVIHESYILGMCVLGITIVVAASVFVIEDYGADAALGAAAGGAAGAFAFCAAAVA